MRIEKQQRQRISRGCTFVAILAIFLMGTMSLDLWAGLINIDLRIPPETIVHEGAIVPVQVWLVSTTSPTTEWSSADLIFEWSAGMTYMGFVDEPLNDLISMPFPKTPAENGYGWSGTHASFGGVFQASASPGTHITTLRLLAGSAGSATVSILDGDLLGDTVVYDGDFGNITGSKGVVSIAIVPYVPVPGDFDHDEDVGQSDIQQFVAWTTGPNVPYANPNAQKADFDNDQDVDLDDFGVMQRCYSGDHTPGDPGCAD